MTYDEAMTIQPRNSREAAEAYRVLDFYLGPLAELKKLLLQVQMDEMLDRDKRKFKKKRMKTMKIPMEGFYDGSSDSNRRVQGPVAEKEYVSLFPNEMSNDEESMPVQSVPAKNARPD